MVMGDVLAVCLMQLNNFSDHDFARYHPGGNLGKRLYLRVADLYKNNEKPKVSADTGLKGSDCGNHRKKIGCYRCSRSSTIKVLGIITDGDLEKNA